MLQANWLMNTNGKTPQSFAVLDLMRMPLGILTGVGFIGGGVILKRGDSVFGLTTAATLWFVTVIGLCFGGGQIGLGLAGSACGFVVLLGFRWIEGRMLEYRPANLDMVLRKGGKFDVQKALQLINAADLKITKFTLRRDPVAGFDEFKSTLKQKRRRDRHGLPEGIAALDQQPDVVRWAWTD
jgi:putative Mg2+ transporter-C (MgtC) family protein